MDRTRRHLLLVPGGLAVGHVAELMAGGHGIGWSAGLVRALVCIGGPLGVWAALLAARDGWRGRSRAARPGALVAQQVLAFGAVDLIEHTLRGSSPLALVARPGFWASVALHALVGLAGWLTLRLATRVGRGLAAVTFDDYLGWPSTATAARWRRSVEAARVLALSSLSRRGPPMVASAPLTA